MAEDRSYSDEEVEAIFRRAFERQVAEGEGYGHEELVAAAREMGLDDDAVDRAVAEVDGHRTREAIRAELRRDQRLAWTRHLIGYLIVVGAALGLHAAGLAGVWAIWLAAVWGAGLAMHGVSAWSGPSERQIRREQGRRNRRARRIAKAKARREARRRAREERGARARRQREAEDELERVIEEGVTLLLGVAARKLSEASAGLEARQARDRTDPDSEFGRDVARQKARERGEPAPGAPSSPARPRVRVDAAAEPDPEEAEAPESSARSRRRRR